MHRYSISDVPIKLEPGMNSRLVQLSVMFVVMLFPLVLTVVITHSLEAMFAGRSGPLLVVWVVGIPVLMYTTVTGRDRIRIDSAGIETRIKGVVRHYPWRDIEDAGIEGVDDPVYPRAVWIRRASDPEDVPSGALIGPQLGIEPDNLVALIKDGRAKWAQIPEAAEPRVATS